MTVKAKRRILLVVGWFFFVLGILGLFLPILQGVLFLLIALVLLAKANPRFRLLKQRIRRRYPKYANLLEKAEQRAADVASGKMFKRNRRD